MSDVEVRTSALGGDVVTVLRKVRIAGAAEEVRSIVDRLGPRVRREGRKPARQPLLKTHLQRVVVGITARLEQVDIIKARIGTRHERQSRRQRARLRLVDVTSG